VAWAAWSCGSGAVLRSGGLRTHPLSRATLADDDSPLVAWEAPRSNPAKASKVASAAHPKKARGNAKKGPARPLELVPGQVPTGLPLQVEQGGREQAAGADQEEPEQLALAIGYEPDLVKAAQDLLGQPMEPEAFAQALFGSPALADAGHVPGGEPNVVANLYLRLRHARMTYGDPPPAAGDLVFLHNTRDVNRNQRTDDWYVTVGVVTEVESDGTVTFIAPGVRAVEALRLNLEHPKARRDEGRQALLNSYVRPRRLEDPPLTHYLAGELFAGFARVR
jgi:hypothetical protein